jgi:uncharacterized protein (TIGR02145 family)
MKYLFLTMRILIRLLLFCALIFACSAPAVEQKRKNKKPVAFKEVEPSQAYESCQIGKQIWMAQNLNEPHFKNGDPIRQAKTKEEWEKAGNTCTPAWCYYNNDPKLGQQFGKLYNWYAVNDPRGLAPKGWTIATNTNYFELISDLTKLDKDAMALQHNSFIGNYPDADALNFHAYGSGYRKESGIFTGKDDYACYWSSDTATAYSAYTFDLKKKQLDPLLGAYYKSGGFSVRCIKK